MVFRVVSFLQVPPPNPCVHFSSLCACHMSRLSDPPLFSLSDIPVVPRSINILIYYTVMHNTVNNSSRLPGLANSQAISRSRGPFPLIETYWKFPGKLDHLHIFYRYQDCGKGDSSLRCTPQERFYTAYLLNWGAAVAQWPRCCSTNREVAGSILAGVIGIFHWHKNSSDRNMVLGSTQPLTEMSTRSISCG